MLTSTFCSCSQVQVKLPLRKAPILVGQFADLTIVCRPAGSALLVSLRLELNFGCIRSLNELYERDQNYLP